jgi:hypothetical protein
VCHPCATVHPTPRHSSTTAQKRATPSLQFTPLNETRFGSALPRERHNWRGGGGGTGPPRRRYLFLKPYFFLS